MHEGRPVYLQDVAQVRAGPDQPEQYVTFGTGPAAAQRGIEFDGTAPAVTIAVSKKPGENAIDVTRAVIERVELLRGTYIPDGVEVTVTRDYGVTANDKAQKLIQKLMFATASVVLLVWLTVGWREAVVVGSAVIITLAATLFASWAWGFTINRVSLFALIFSIGILVDDAIVVVENINRHMGLHPGVDLGELIPRAVDEVGGPDHPRDLHGDRGAAADGVRLRADGPVHEPHPHQRQHGHADLAGDRAGVHAVAVEAAAVARERARAHDDARRGVAPAPLLRARDVAVPARRRGAARAATSCTSARWSRSDSPSRWWSCSGSCMKMLPFDNKSEFQVVVDMPEGTALEETGRVLDELAAAIAGLPEVTDYQIYAGTSAPINFNGLVRQYYLRSGPELGDIQVNLVDKHHRDRKSHEIATAARPALAEIGRRYGAAVKVVEVPPGPPVQAPLVAEIYGPFRDAQRELTQAVRKVFDATPDVVDVDDSLEAERPRLVVAIDRAEGRAARREPGRGGAGAGGGTRRPRCHLRARGPRDLPGPGAPRARRARQGRPLRRARAAGPLARAVRRVPLSEIAVVEERPWDEAIYHKDLLPVTFVTADAVGRARQPAVRHVRHRRRAEGLAARRASTSSSASSARPRIPTATR